MADHTPSSPAAGQFSFLGELPTSPTLRLKAKSKTDKRPRTKGRTRVRYSPNQFVQMDVLVDTELLATIERVCLHCPFTSRELLVEAWLASPFTLEQSLFHWALKMLENLWQKELGNPEPHPLG